jgi:hypothetical protein
MYNDSPIKSHLYLCLCHSKFGCLVCLPVVLIAAGLWGGCDKKASTPAEKPLQKHAVKDDQPHTTNNAALKKLSCRQLHKKYQHGVKNASLKCAANKDCVHYPDGYSTCGGIVTRAVYEKKMKPIYQELTRRKECRKTYPCPHLGSSRYKPVCHKGKCMSFCDKLADRFATILKKAPGTCKADSDCAHYPGGLTDCGGITDKTTAQKLKTLFGEMRAKHKCILYRRCAKRVPLVPICEKGHCTGRRRSLRKAKK